MIGLSRNFQRTLLFAFTLCLAAFGLEISAHADTPPATRAARLTFVQGTVTVNTPGYTENVPAQVNLPLLAGVQVITGGDGQAEVEFEDGSIARLTPNSALSLDNLSVEPSGVFATGISLMHGLAYFELRATPQYLYTVAAGGDLLTPVENTTVRVNFDEPPATFAVLDGTAHVERRLSANVDAANGGFQADVRAGESLRGDAVDATRYFLNAGITQDSWDQWNEDMDQTEATQAADSTSVRNNYEGAQGYGWSDLDANGTWYNVPGQGPVWQPQLAADDMSFDPYGDGEWIAYPGAGYIWASAYPWGWTPYRCGTWSFFGGFGWGWAPGAGCGGFGWGFYGGGQVVNIGVGPGGYRPVRVPLGPTGPHPIRPVMPVHTYHHEGPARPVQYGQRQFAGKTAVAITPGHNTFNSGSTSGSSLRRDFPVDSKSHAPVLGLASTTPTAVHANRGRQDQPEAARPTTVFPNGGQRPATGAPAYNGPSRPDNGQYRPNNGQGVPANGQAVPANGQARPDNGQFRQNNGQAVPASGQGAPANGQARPDSGQARPDNGQFRPNNGQGVPANGQARPDNGQARPDNGQFRQNNGQSGQQPGGRSQPSTPQPAPGPSSQPASPQRYTPPPSQPSAPSHPTYSPPPSQPSAPSHPTYSPPPSQPSAPSHPTYSPPPSQPSAPSHPTYSPPPSQPSAPSHPTYSPPPSQPSAPSHPTYSPPPSQPSAPSHPTYSPPPSQPSAPSHPSYSPPPSPPPSPPSGPTPSSPPPSSSSSSPHNSPK